MTPLRNFLSALLAFGTIAASHSAPFEITPAPWRGASQPQVAATSGGVFATFGSTGAVFCATSADAGKTFSSPIRIGALPKLALGMRRGPRIAASPKAVVISAISHADGNLYAWTSPDHGATWSEARRINSTTNSAREGMHAMTGDGQGTVHAAWLDLRNGPTELWGASSKDGGISWGENRPIYKSPDGHICECCHPSLAVDGTGRVWAMWRNWLDGARDMYACVSTNNGNSFGPARKLGSGTWTLKACPMDGGNIAFDPMNRPLTTWRRDKSLFIAGETSEEQLALAGSHPVVGTSGGHSYFVWQTGAKLMMRKDASLPIMLAENGAFASIATAPGEPPVVVWESNREGVKTIFVQRLE